MDNVKQRCGEAGAALASLHLSQWKWPSELREATERTMEASLRTQPQQPPALAPGPRPCHRRSAVAPPLGLPGSCHSVPAN